MPAYSSLHAAAVRVHVHAQMYVHAGLCLESQLCNTNVGRSNWLRGPASGQLERHRKN